MPYMIQSLRSTKQLEVSVEALEGVIGGDDDFLISLMRWFLRLGWLTTISLAVTFSEPSGFGGSLIGSSVSSSSRTLLASGSTIFTHIGPSGSNTASTNHSRVTYQQEFTVYFFKIGHIKKSKNRVCGKAGDLPKFIVLYHTGAKMLNLSKKSHFKNINLHKIHIFKISFFTKFTLFETLKFYGIFG